MLLSHHWGPTITNSRNYQQPTWLTPISLRKDMFMQILRAHSGVWVLYTTGLHVCIYWIPPFDLHVATFPARRWGKWRDGGNSQYVMMEIISCILPSTYTELSRFKLILWRWNKEKAFIPTDRIHGYMGVCHIRNIFIHMISCNLHRFIDKTLGFYC